MLIDTIKYYCFINDGLSKTQIVLHLIIFAHALRLELFTTSSAVFILFELCKLTVFYLSVNQFVVNMETRHYWEDNGHSVKFESYNATNEEYVRVAAEPVIFAAPSEDEAEYPPNNYLKKGKQDPMSHRIIEKRRRDRMNNCLADLSRLIPPEYLKKGRGRVEKTEIIEMAIRHLKYLQERVNGLYHTMEQNNKLNNAAENQVGEEHFRAGFQEAMSEAMTFLVEVQGYGPGDGLCLQLATHLQRHCERVAKGECLPSKSQGVSSETTSSSSSTHGYMDKPGVITQARRTEPPPEPPPLQPEPFEEESPSDLSYSLEKDQGEQIVSAESEVSSGTVSRRSDAPDEYLHSYKFKNSIERRFSRSQDCEQPTDMTIRSNNFNGKVIPHKRRRTVKALPSACNSTSGSGSGSTGEQQCDVSPQSTMSEVPHHHFDKSSEDSSQFVPVFALNALGKYYVPLSIEHDCLTRHLGSYSVLEARGAQDAAPLHPVTIHVNFQPCLTYRVKRELPDAEWRAA